MLLQLLLLLLLLVLLLLLFVLVLHWLLLLLLLPFVLVLHWLLLLLAAAAGASEGSAAVWAAAAPGPLMMLHALVLQLQLLHHPCPVISAATAYASVGVCCCFRCCFCCCFCFCFCCCFLTCEYVVCCCISFALS